MWITAAMMIVEIAVGWWFNSMALLADGWHMSSHAVAIGLSAFAYAAARRYARDPRFAFGTWKIEVLGRSFVSLRRRREAIAGVAVPPSPC
jgi:Co/Zn/Cd efflux system component